MIGKISEIRKYGETQDLILRVPTELQVQRGEAVQVERVLRGPDTELQADLTRARAALQDALQTAGAQRGGMSTVARLLPLLGSIDNELDRLESVAAPEG